MVMLIIGGIDVFQGLIALFEDEYFVPTGSGFLVFDLTGWGWTMVFWGVLLFFAGVGLIAGQGWARWFAIVVVALNVIAQLGFLGNNQYPLWSLTVMALNIIVLYALTARWRREPDRDQYRPLSGFPGRGRRAASCAAASPSGGCAQPAMCSTAA